MTDEEKDAAAAMVKLHENVEALVQDIVIRFLLDPYGPMHSILQNNQAALYPIIQKVLYDYVSQLKNTSSTSSGTYFR